MLRNQRRTQRSRKEASANRSAGCLLAEHSALMS